MAVNYCPFRPVPFFSSPVQLACLHIVYLTPKTFTKLWADQMQMNQLVSCPLILSAAAEIININIHPKEVEINRDYFQLYVL
jgi:hypothetical protein